MVIAADRFLRYRLQGASSLVAALLGIWAFVLLSACAAGTNGRPIARSKIRGQVLLDIIQPGEVHNILAVIPERGEVTHETTTSDQQSIASESETRFVPSCYNNPRSLSPDGNFAASCKGDPVATMVGAKPDEMVLTSTKTDKVLYTGGMAGHQKINGFLWSPDSKGVAVLSSNVRVSANPRYWFRAISGHPKQFETYYLTVIELEPQNTTSFKVPFEGSSSRARLITWKAAESPEGR